MKLKGWVVFFFFVAFLVLEGCSLSEYAECTESLDQVKIYSAYWQPADSALLEFAADSEHYGTFAYDKYNPRAKGLKKKVTDDTTVYTFSLYSVIGPESDVFSIRFSLRYNNSSSWYDQGALTDSLFVDIYGCSDYGCANADRIVVHNEDFSFSKLLKKDNFDISEPGGSFHSVESGFDCEVVKEYFFHLKIDLDDVKIDLDAQKGYESCYHRSSKWCIYC